MCEEEWFEQTEQEPWKDGPCRGIWTTACEDVCCMCVSIGRCVCEWGLSSLKKNVMMHNFEQAYLTQCFQERPQLGPEDSSLGLHKGNTCWCVVVEVVHEALLQRNCSYSPEFRLYLKWQSNHKHNMRNWANKSDTKLRQGQLCIGCYKSCRY